MINSFYTNNLRLNLIKRCCIRSRFLHCTIPKYDNSNNNYDDAKKGNFRLKKDVYDKSQREKPEFSMPPPPISAIELMAERRIQEAIKSGAYENISGFGKPWQKDLYRDHQSQIGNQDNYEMAKIMAANKVLPKSLEAQKEILTEWKLLKKKISSNWKKWLSAVKGRQIGTEQDFEDYLKSEGLQYQSAFDKLNRDVKKANSLIVTDQITFSLQFTSPIRHMAPFRYEHHLRISTLIFDSKGNKD